MDKEGWGDPDEDVEDEIPSSHNTPISARQASLCTMGGDVKHLMANTVTGRRLGQAMHHLFELLRCDSNDARRERRPAQRKPTPLREPKNHGTTNEEKGDSLPTPMHPDWNTRTDRGEHVLLPESMMTAATFPKPSSAQSLTNALQLHFDRPSAPYPGTQIDAMDNPLCTWRGDLIKERRDGRNHSGRGLRRGMDSHPRG